MVPVALTRLTTRFESDWHTEESVPWWTGAMMAHHKNVPWDGIWLDMNEVSSFCIGSCGTGNLSLNPVHPPFGLPGEEGSRIFTYPVRVLPLLCM